MRRLIICTCILVTYPLLQQTAAQTPDMGKSRQAGSVSFEPYLLKSGSQEIAAELGHLVVKENRRQPDSKPIELAFVRLKSTAAKPGYPVVYLDGGPGSSKELRCPAVRCRDWLFPFADK